MTRDVEVAERDFQDSALIFASKWEIQNLEKVLISPNINVLYNCFTKTNPNVKVKLPKRDKKTA